MSGRGAHGERFGGIDILVNNASAISLTRHADTPMKRFDLMQQVNTRGTFLCSQRVPAAPRRPPNPHILMLSPPPSCARVVRASPGVHALEVSE